MGVRREIGKRGKVSRGKREKNQDRNNKTGPWTPRFVGMHTERRWTMTRTPFVCVWAVICNAQAVACGPREDVQGAVLVCGDRSSRSRRRRSVIFASTPRCRAAEGRRAAETEDA